MQAHAEHRNLNISYAICEAEKLSKAMQRQGQEWKAAKFPQYMYPTELGNQTKYVHTDKNGRLSKESVCAFEGKDQAYAVKEYLRVQQQNGGIQEWFNDSLEPQLRERNHELNERLEKARAREKQKGKR